MLRDVEAEAESLRAAVWLQARARERPPAAAAAPWPALPAVAARVGLRAACKRRIDGPKQTFKGPQRTSYGLDYPVGTAQRNVCVCVRVCTCVLRSARARGSVSAEKLILSQYSYTIKKIAIGPTI